MLINSLIKNFDLMFNKILDARNHTPGFAYTRLRNLCCSLDDAKDYESVEYEPGYVQIDESKLCINSPIVRKKEFEVCEKTRNRLLGNFEQFKSFQNQSFSFVRCTERTKDIESSNTDAFFIFNKERSKVLCISIDKWIYPIVTRFVSLNNKPNREMLIGWRLSTMKCREKDGKHVIEQDILESIDMNLLCKKDVEVIPVDLDMFYFELSENSCQNMKQYMELVSAHDKKLDKQERDGQKSEKTVEFWCYSVCLLICFLFFMFNYKDPRKV